MKPAQPFPHGMDTHGFGLGALILAFLVPASLWMVAEAATIAAGPQDARRIAFVHAAAGIQGRLQLLREFEKGVVTNAANARKSGYYRERRDEARRRIDALAKSAAALAEGEERARLGRLEILVRLADARYGQILASAGTETDAFTVVQR